jgi:hypothetical protein
VLRRVFGLKRDGVMGGWRGLHNEELVPLPSVIGMMILWRIKWAGHIAQMGRRATHIG